MAIAFPKNGEKQNCPSQALLWFFTLYANFYCAHILYLILRLRAKISGSTRCGVFLGTIFLFTPWTCVSTFLANTEIEKLDQGEAVCIRNSGFGLFALVYLVLNYVTLLMLIL